MTETSGRAENQARRNCPRIYAVSEAPQFGWEAGVLGRCQRMRDPAVEVTLATVPKLERNRPCRLRRIGLGRGDALALMESAA